MKTKKELLFFVFTALLWGVILGLGVIAGESQADCTDDEQEEYDYYITYLV